MIFLRGVIGELAADKGAVMDGPVVTTGTCAWRPLLEGELAAQARAVARDIAQALDGREPVDLSEATDAVVFWAYAAETFPEPWVDAAYDQALDNLATTIAAGACSLAMFGGLTGAAWAAQHVAGDAEPGDDDEDEGDLPPWVDGVLLRALERSDWVGPYDLIGGLVGYGVYFLAGLRRSTAQRGLTITMQRLVAWAEPLDGSLAWRTPPELLPAHHRRKHADGLFDLGLAHGVVGVIALQSAVLLAQALPDWERQTRRSLEGALAFLEANRHMERARSAFDWCLAPGATGTQARTAWCYGDLGAAIALLRAAAALRDDTWFERGVELARASASRPHEACGVRDAGLCHGAAGLGHFLNRLYQATGDSVVRDGARRWFRDTLERRTPAYLGGFPSYTHGAISGGPSGWASDPGILTGAGGVGLALMSALGGSPDWDQFLMTDLSPGSSRAG